MKYKSSSLPQRSSVTCPSSKLMAGSVASQRSPMNTASANTYTSKCVQENSAKPLRLLEQPKGPRTQTIRCLSGCLDVGCLSVQLRPVLLERELALSEYARTALPAHD